jgi:hypothetical protein
MDCVDPILPDDEDHHEKVINNDSKKEETMKQYADQRNHAKKINFEVGDYVLVPQQKKNKLSTPFDKMSYTE